MLKHKTHFYSIYFIIQFNIELIFANTSIIEYYWFFSPELHPLLVYFYSPTTSMISVFLFRKKPYSKFKVYCKQNRHFYRDFFLRIPDFFNFILVTQLKFLSKRFWCDFFLIIFLNGINWLIKSHRKIPEYMLNYSLPCSCS
jgi:hypothetical protein